MNPDPALQTRHQAAVIPIALSSAPFVRKMASLFRVPEHVRGSRLRETMLASLLPGQLKVPKATKVTPVRSKFLTTARSLIVSIALREPAQLKQD